MSIASEIQRLQGVRANIFNAIAAKGVSVPSGAKLADCPELISLISGGGGFVEIGGIPYPVVKIGSQLWIAENFKSKIGTLNIDYKLYNGNIEPYGVFYNWNSTNNLSSILPNGWRIPTESDVRDLIQFIGGYKNSYKIRTQGWTDGTDEYGFNLKPSGDFNDYGNPEHQGSQSNFWTSDAESDSIGIGAFVSDPWIIVSNTNSKNKFYTVRFVKDA